MFIITGVAGRLADRCSFRNALRPSVKTCREELYPTWIKSLYVWAPVQVVQQAWVPLEYRVAVFNLVSYFWDTYLAIKMAPEAHRADLEQLQVPGPTSATQASDRKAAPDCSPSGC